MDANETAATLPTLTAKERTVLDGIAQGVRDNDDAGHRPLIELSVWTLWLCDDIGLNPRSRGGVFASLAKKGLIWSDSEGPKQDWCCSLTAAGWALLEVLEA